VPVHGLIWPVCCSPHEPAGWSLPARHRFCTSQSPKINLYIKQSLRVRQYHCRHLRHSLSHSWPCHLLIVHDLLQDENDSYLFSAAELHRHESHPESRWVRSSDNRCALNRRPPLWIVVYKLTIPRVFLEIHIRVRYAHVLVDE